MGNHKNILVADDDVAILEVMNLILEDAGYKVTTTVNGSLVLKLGRDQPDLILLDLWMSGVNGRDICRKLKTQKKTAHIPIIIISANKDGEKIARECKANEFLAKPFEINDLLKLVEKYTS